MELQYPVDDLRVKVNQHAEEHSTASNAVAAPARRRVVRRYARLKAQQIFLAVHRVEFTVYYRRLDPGEFRLLQAIGGGQAIGSALEAALAGNHQEPAELEQRFKPGLQIGLRWAGCAEEQT